MDWGWYSDSNTFRLFIHLLLNATHKVAKWRDIELKPGQMITGRKVLARELKLSERAIRTSLKRLKSTNEVTIESTNSFSVVTICNWGLYQRGEDDQQLTKRPTDRPANDQPVTTYKKLRSKEDNSNVIFEEFRKAFPGTKRGFSTELENFLKNNDPKIAHLLKPALEREKQHRAKCVELKTFVPEWKNLSTWINSKSWETEFSEINSGASKTNPKNQLNFRSEW